MITTLFCNIHHICLLKCYVMYAKCCVAKLTKKLKTRQVVSLEIVVRQIRRIAIFLYFLYNFAITDGYNMPSSDIVLYVTNFWKLRKTSLSEISPSLTPTSYRFVQYTGLEKWLHNTRTQSTKHACWLEAISATIPFKNLSADVSCKTLYVNQILYRSRFTYLEMAPEQPQVRAKEQVSAFNKYQSTVEWVYTYTTRKRYMKL